MPLLANFGTLSYNGYDFDGAAHLTINVDFVRDDADRTILYHQHTIHVDAIIQDDEGTDTRVWAIRRILGEQGREFILRQRGFGSDLVVNSGQSPIRDVRWGPKPRILAWENIGGNKAVGLKWECVVCVPLCDNGDYPRTDGLLSFNYGVSFAVDQKGYTTRTISGHLLIAQTRIGRAVPDTADAYLNAYQNLPIPQGFKRSATRQISLDKSRLDFTIVDEQIPSPNAYPPGIIEITAKHRAGWRRGSGLPRNTISAEIEVDATQAPEHALLIFSALANRRIAFAEAQVPPATSVDGGQSGSPVTVLIDSFDVEEDIYSRRSSFSLSYRVPSTLKQFIADCGLWIKQPDTWGAWHASVPESQKIDGHAGIRHFNFEDRITDACELPQYAPSAGFYQNVLQGRGQVVPLKNKKPDPVSSWLSYNHVASIHRERPVARQATLQASDTEPAVFYPNEISGISYPPNAGTIDTIQQGGQSSYRATVTGKAIRAGYPIPRPKYATVGAANATETDGEFHQSIIENWFGLPIYGAMWRMEYVLDQSPGDVALLPNPMEHLNGDGTASR